MPTGWEWIENSSDEKAYPVRIGTSEDVNAEWGQNRNASFIKQLVRSFELEVVEDGVSHPAEYLMTQMLQTIPGSAASWIEDAYFDTCYSRPVTASGILRCIGRLPKQYTAEWGEDLASEALWQDDPEIRESAIRAFERWGNTRAIDELTLRLEEESEPWLRDYMSEVIADLSA